MRAANLHVNRTTASEQKTIAPRSHILGRSAENRAFEHRARAKHCLAVAANLGNGATPAPRAPADPYRALRQPMPPRRHFSPQTAPRSSIKMPSNIPVAPKSQYEIERDERIKRNEAFMLSIGIDPHGGGYMKQNLSLIHI